MLSDTHKSTPSASEKKQLYHISVGQLQKNIKNDSTSSI